MDKTTIYHIRIKEQITDTWADWFDPLAIHYGARAEQSDWNFTRPVLVLRICAGTPRYKPS